jgi:hypothetical protein
MFLEFSFLAKKKGGDRKFEKIRRSTNRGRGEDLRCSQTDQFAEGAAQTPEKKTEDFLREGEASPRKEHVGGDAKLARRGSYKECMQR